ncbi:MAG: rod shape-determining protein RodA [Lachnospiraceae bacterium]|nr:rod shape-determining protein RodA [Lachnospiraceae bacterium]
MLKKYKWRYYDIRLVILVILASVMGIYAIGSANESYQGRQIMGVGIGVVLMLIISVIDYTKILKLYWLIYAVMAVLLFVTLYTDIGDSSNNAQRWIQIGSFTFQPSEISKLLLILFLAQFIMKYRSDLNKPWMLLIIAVLFAVPAYLILKQPDLSTAIVIATILCTLLFVGGISWKYVVAAFAIVIPVGAIFIFLAIQPDSTLLASHQQERILAYLYPEEYPDTAWQQLYSVKAIASGQLDGKGYKNNEVTSLKNGSYILEPHTDFIFAVIGEEFGFKGSVAVIAVLFSIVLECLYAAYKAKDMAGRLVAAGVAAWIGFQSFFNIGVATLLLPNTGLPLPFISYGLTSLLSLYMGIGFVLNVKLQQRKKREGIAS